jgi:DNA-binding YbaB/EbfC family protein
MKRILLIAVLLGTMITATTYFVCIAAPSVLFGKGIKGSGNIVTRTIDAPDFDRVDAARAVKVVITGKHECKSVVIDPSVVDPEDVEMLQDLIQLAFNSAQTRLSEISEERMRKEVPLPPGMKLPF